jgi:hypothetical protein
MSNLQLSEMMEKECLEVSRVFKVSCYAERIASGTSLAKHIACIAVDFDMVVMGTNGEDSFFQDVFGSNAFRVIKKTRGKRHKNLPAEIQSGRSKEYILHDRQQAGFLNCPLFHGIGEVHEQSCR